MIKIEMYYLKKFDYDCISISKESLCLFVFNRTVLIHNQRQALVEYNISLFPQI